MASLRILLVTLPAVTFAASLGHEHISSIPMYQYKADCGTKSRLHVIPGAAAMLQVDNVPGAGIKPFKAFETVLKDGFMQTDCVKDYMYYRGDKFGDNKHDYKLGPVSNVSIVHYDAVVAKEDRQEMTQKVCFEFCRTVPNMGFFGIVNGRNCYCTPYFTSMESDSSQCDAVCEGEKTLMCGGKSKSSIFAMHMCASTGEDLGERAGRADALKASINTKVGTAKGLSNNLQSAGETVQADFGQVGDSSATGLAQATKVFAGKLVHKAEEAEKIADALGDLSKSAGALSDFTDPEQVTKAERIMEGIDETLAQGEATADELDALIESASPAESHAGAAKEYYPVMYFVDKEYEDVPSTCAGDIVGQPMVGSEDDCASACDAHIHSCVGYQFFGMMKQTTCVLLSNFKTGFYYTGCGGGKKAAFMQAMKSKGGPAVCYAKLSKFEGTTLKPNPSGKCEQCFNELTKADRCY